MATKNMKRLIVFLVVLALSGCATTSNSSLAPKTLLQGDFPKRVGVFPFSGTQPYAEKTSEFFSVKLRDTGYFEQVAEIGKIQQTLQKFGYQYRGFVDGKTVTQLGQQFGLDAVFVGQVITHSPGVYIDSTVVVKLVDIKTGMIIWGCQAKDSRLFSMLLDLSLSTEAAARGTLAKLEKDFKKVRKSYTVIDEAIIEEKTAVSKRF